MNSNKLDDTFVRRCISYILSGLSDGLSRLTGFGRVAVIYRVSENSQTMICDPQNILQEHKPKLNECLLMIGSRDR